ncbi:methylenetetrahydrofolate reductase (NADPH) [Methylomarinovum caldicuralii]|uniref:Methylenetetrahydrofolate reductase n=1 Tax=Methylomarinovum caldicuralii TaxID=438856 RepID=A0AAU9CCH1_9GAMM|nr:methylenetetrahydrofolate reductase [NAD(P)H] [Methylomarinovum caldicuralii]BCX80645.1 methylenetetrahydrofolate reductase (NADPH) [Methylomarinovum caldicuralii]
MNRSIALSFEFFPPRSAEMAAQLRDTYRQLAQLEPVYFSVTYGAGGSTRDKTFETVLEIQCETGIEAAPHLSCIGSTRAEIRALLDQYRARGIRRIVALRGDLPSGMRADGDFRYASDLVAFIRAETGDHFHLEVAAYPETHPQAPSYPDDLQHFVTKVEAGADGAITQYFYNADAYFHFVADCRDLGVTIPIVPGIMPVTNYAQLARFSDLCGAEIPRWMRKRLEAFDGNLAAIRAFGIEVVTKLCQRLIEGGVPGLHFYTMNRVEPTLTICRNLGLA